MTQRAPGRKRSLVALTALAMLVLGVLAPAALAQVSTSQLPGGDAVGAVTNTVTDTVTGGGSGSSGDAGSGGGGGGGGGGGSTVGAVGGTVKDTTSTTTDKATGGVGTVVDSTSGTVKETVQQTDKTVDNTTSETGTAVHNTLNGAGELGGNVTNPLINANDPRKLDRGDGGRVPNGERNLGPNGTGDRKAAYQGESSGDRATKNRDRGDARSAAADKNRSDVSSKPAYAEAPQRQTFMTQLAQAAEDAAEKLAFPLGLALMVGAFLMVQGRIDRKDAKLVLAPIDSEQDLLSFQ